MQETLGILVLENADGEVQLALHLAVYLLHHHDGNLLVRDARDERVFKNVGEWAVPDVVHQDGCLEGFGLGIENEDAFLLE